MRNHVLKILQRRETRTIQQVQETQGHNITKPKEVRNAIVGHLRQKNIPKHVDNDSLLMMEEFIQHVGTTNDEQCWTNLPQLKRSIMHCEQAPATNHRASM